ncbi:Tigger transposable element-derived protein 6 [Holothuria leucospilota]|uniref:Tigger transposable element-derived protein 6 n=1 Tax=Holothuria leucospilota TaxID=206669 RepID=A0A9Q1CE16_HOLLE|nr:Tigger transposable element-derived protein 6 [Holothuria leucospilota]
MNDELDLRENLQFFENEAGPSEGLDSLPPGITPAISKFIQQAIADTVQAQSKNKIDDPSAFKLKVAKELEEKGKHHAAWIFHVNKKRFRKWCRDTDKLATPAKQMAARWGRKVCFQDIDEELIKWFQERRTAGICVTGKGVKYEALQLHKQHGNQNFRASNGWYLKFVK